MSIKSKAVLIHTRYTERVSFSDLQAILDVKCPKAEIVAAYDIQRRLGRKIIPGASISDLFASCITTSHTRYCNNSTLLNDIEMVMKDMKIATEESLLFISKHGYLSKDDIYKIVDALELLCFCASCDRESIYRFHQYTYYDTTTLSVIAIDTESG